ncbi:MAG: ROK family protein [Terriglobales bacterium]
MPEASASDGLVIGVDVGGTKVAAGFVNSDGEITTQVRAPMVANGDSAAGFAAVRAAIDSLLSMGPKTQAIHGIGICSPGPLDPRTGVVINPPNLPCWRNFPLAAEVSRMYRIPVKVDNDANAAGLAEALWGAGAGHRNVFYATIGTGIGTGMIFDGCLYHGRTGAAGEGGHMSIDYQGPLCGCGKRGCIEALAAGPAIGRRARGKLAEKSQRDSILWNLAGMSADAITSEMVGRADVAGDAVAHEVLLETVALLALWLSNIVDLLEPDVIIMGGGVASMLKPFFGAMHEQISDSCVNSRGHEIPLVPACYGANSGVAGGAALCAQPQPATPVPRV